MIGNTFMVSAHGQKRQLPTADFSSQPNAMRASSLPSRRSVAAYCYLFPDRKKPACGKKRKRSTRCPASCTLEDFERRYAKTSNQSVELMATRRTIKVSDD